MNADWDNGRRRSTVAGMVDVSHDAAVSSKFGLKIEIIFGLKLALDNHMDMV